MVLSDFSGLQKCFESEANVPHVVHRWRAEFLQYQLVIWNQPARMTWECDMLSKYNRYTESWTENYVEKASTEVSLATNSVM